MKFARKRDANERAIITAMEAMGASVAQLEGAGVPDLLVSFDGVMHLVEVKDVKPGAKRVHKGKHDDTEHPELTPAQVTWWKKWRGEQPSIIKNVDEARELLRGMKEAKRS